MARVSITVCDACQAVGADTGVWAIHAPDGSRNLDLCHIHSRELGDFLDRLVPGIARQRQPPKRTARRRPREGRFDSRVTTFEELQERVVASRAQVEDRPTHS